MNIPLKTPLPAGFLRRMRGQLGNQFDEFLQVMDSPLNTAVRLHPVKKALRYEFELNDPVRWAQDAFFLDKRPVFTLDPTFHAGGYYVQEPASMLLELVFKKHLANLKNPCVLDLCASPGGKSTSLLSQLNSKGLLVSNEVISSRIGPLQHNLIKWGYSNQIITQSDPSRFKQLSGLFDLILVDAPCSGEGLFRKDEASRSEWTENNAHQCSMRQQRILNDVLHALKPGGVLVYSTCTYNPGENIDQLEWLQHLGMDCIPSPELEKYPLVKIEKGKVHGFQAYPHLIKGEGFFIGVLQKNTPRQISSSGQGGSIHWTLPPKEADPYLPKNSGMSFFKHDDTYFTFPSVEENHLEQLSALRIISAGCALGQLKNTDFIPSHNWALSLDIPNSLEGLDLDKEQAIRFLKKDVMAKHQEKSGYLLIRYQGLNLGWVKGLKDRYNNLLPKNNRILMNG